MPHKLRNRGLKRCIVLIQHEINLVTNPSGDSLDISRPITAVSCVNQENSPIVIYVADHPTDCLIDSSEGIVQQICLMPVLRQIIDLFY